MSKLRKKFTRQERLEIVKQSFEADAQVSKLAQRYGVSSNTLSNWRRKFRQEQGLEPKGQGIKVMSDEERQIASLKRQLEETRLERDILKKAIGIFSQNDGKSFSS